MVYEDVSDRVPPFPFHLRQVLAGPHENFHYIVGDPATREAAVIDPAFELDRIFDAAERDGYRIRSAFFTHGHWDHIGGVPEIFEQGVEAAYIHEEGAGVAQVAAHRDRFQLLGDGDELHIGNLPVRILHTPGHQPEASCYLVGAPGGPRALFGGDTLFVDSCGRTDFPGGDTDAMFVSMARLRALAEDAGGGAVTLFPGHHYADAPHRPLVAQVEENPALATTDRTAFGVLHCLTH